MTDDRIYADERRYEIVRLTRENGRADVTALAERFGVSTETIRQDLNALQASGHVRRVHGGALPLDRTLIETQVSERTSFTAEKLAIATSAAARIPESGAIFIESGSTAQLLAEHLPPHPSLTVFTNSLPVAMTLAQHPELTVITLGGRVRPMTLGEVDSFAIRSLREINVDVAFLGTNGLSLEHGLTTPDQAEADFKRETLSVASTTVLLADRSKLGTVALWRYGAIADIDVLITSGGADARTLDGAREAGVELDLV